MLPYYEFNFAWNRFGFVGLGVFCLCFVSSDQTCKVDLSKKADSSDARLPHLVLLKCIPTLSKQICATE